MQFSISFSTDRDGFWRRTCPSCSRDFKTDYGEINLTSVLAPQFRRMECEIGVSLALEETEETSGMQFACPYCGHESPHGEMLTSEAIQYMHRFLIREIAIPKFNQAISRGLSSGNGSRKKSGGIFSISLEHHRSLRPCRPIHGPEPPDMKIVEFLCCERKAKIAKRWYSLEKCIYCQTPVALV